MSRPPEIVSIQPTAIATFSALRWVGDPDDEALAWMAEQYGWKITGMRDTRKGRALVVIGKNSKRYTIGNGEWVIALGSNGSMTVISDRQYRQNYREVEA